MNYAAHLNNETYIDETFYRKCQFATNENRLWLISIRSGLLRNRIINLKRELFNLVYIVKSKNWFVFTGGIHVVPMSKQSQMRFVDRR